MRRALPIDQLLLDDDGRHATLAILKNGVVRVRVGRHILSITPSADKDAHPVFFISDGSGLFGWANLESRESDYFTKAIRG